MVDLLIRLTIWPTRPFSIMLVNGSRYFWRAESQLY